MRRTHGDQGYNAVWAETLGVDAKGVTSAVAGVFGLIHDIDAALAITDDDYMIRLVDRYRDDWALAVVPQASGRSQALKHGPSEAGLDALGAVASHLRSNLPEGVIPDGEATATLRSQVETLISELRKDDSIPDEVRIVMVGRLHDLAWALDHVEIGGAGAVQVALDRLVLAYAVRHQQEAHTDAEASIWKRIVKVCQTASELISAPGAWASSGQFLLTAGESIRAITGG